MNIGSPGPEQSSGVVLFIEGNDLSLETYYKEKFIYLINDLQIRRSVGFRGKIIKNFYTCSLNR